MKQKFSGWLLKRITAWHGIRASFAKHFLPKGRDWQNK